jgi:alpha-beta hydrolase superfamily lysophospholipase
VRARQQGPLALPLPAGGTLRGTVSYSDNVGPALVLFVHGFGSNRTSNKALALEAACARRGWPFAAFDFRGHGESSGTMRELRGSALQEDLDCIWEHFAGRGAQRLFLVGSSMGGWASAWFALRHSNAVPAVVTLAPAFDFLGRRWSALGEDELRAWRETGRYRFRNEWLDVELDYGLVEERDRFTLAELLSRWQAPMLVFHGMADETVPWRESLDFVERCPYPELELRLIKNGDHRLLALKDEMAEEACNFFARWWPGQPDVSG